MRAYRRQWQEKPVTDKPPMAELSQDGFTVKLWRLGHNQYRVHAWRDTDPADSKPLGQWVYPSIFGIQRALQTGLAQAKQKPTKG